VEIISKPYLLLSSGNPEPSEADIQFTRRMSECGELMGIELLDHIIVGEHEFISLKEIGIC
jgi:DNA repair protein RadC